MKLPSKSAANQVLLSESPKELIRRLGTLYEMREYWVRMYPSAYEAHNSLASFIRAVELELKRLDSVKKMLEAETRLRELHLAYEVKRVGHPLSASELEAFEAKYESKRQAQV